MDASCKRNTSKYLDVFKILQELCIEEGLELIFETNHTEMEAIALSEGNEQRLQIALDLV